MDTILGFLTTTLIVVLLVAGLAGAAAVLIIGAIVKAIRGGRGAG